MYVIKKIHDKKNFYTIFCILFLAGLAVIILFLIIIISQLS